MNDGYGKQINLALAAVRRLHADTSKLLVDADSTIGLGKRSVLGNQATRDLTNVHRAEYWMAEGVFRYYVSKPPGEPALIDGLTIRFFDLESRIEEPFLLVGQLKYRLEADSSLTDYMRDQQARRWWHLWDAYAEWGGDRPRPGVVMTGGPLVNKNVEWFKVIGVPLYSIRSMEDVVALMERVRNTEIAPATA